MSMQTPPVKLEHVVDLASQSAVDQDFTGTQPASLAAPELEALHRREEACARLRQTVRDMGWTRDGGGSEQRAWRDLLIVLGLD